MTLPPKGWKKPKTALPKPASKPPVEEEPEVVPDEEPVAKPLRPPPRPIPPTPETDDEESEFVTEKDVKKEVSMGQPPLTDKEPGQKGFITELVAGAGQKLHEVEFGMFGHPVFQHTPADERIWTALGRYAESVLDPTKYGIVILLVVLLGSESMKLAVYAKWRADNAPKNDPKKARK